MNPLKVEGKAPWPVERIYKNYIKAGESIAKSGQAGRTDALELSPHALAIRQLVEEARKLSEEREKLVAEIKARLEAGSYRVEPELVAESMLRAKK